MSSDGRKLSLKAKFKIISHKCSKAQYQIYNKTSAPHSYNIVCLTDSVENEFKIKNQTSKFLFLSPGTIL